MNTQAMSAQLGAIDLSDIEAQRDAIPPMKVNEMNLLSDAMRIELKQLINEVLDERQRERPFGGLGGK